MDNIGIGIELLFLGMGVVFIALIVMIGVMKALGYFSGTNPRKADPKKGDSCLHEGAALATSASSAASAASAVPAASAGISSGTDFSGVSAETVAAISGAIAYMMGSGRSGYAIRSIKPCTGRETFSPWAIAGRIDQVNAGNSLIKRRTS